MQRQPPAAEGLGDWILYYEARTGLDFIGQRSGLRIRSQCGMQMPTVWVLTALGRSGRDEHATNRIPSEARDGEIALHMQASRLELVLSNHPTASSRAGSGWEPVMSSAKFLHSRHSNVHPGFSGVAVLRPRASTERGIISHVMIPFSHTR